MVYSYVLCVTGSPLCTSIQHGENATKLLFNSGLGNKILLLPLFLSFFFF